MDFKKYKKVLFYLQLAIGDYTYLQRYFNALNKKFPNLKVDLFIDERRMTSDISKWDALKNYSIYDWILNEPYFNYVYCENYRPDYYRNAILEAKQEKYDAVIALNTGQKVEYAERAAEIAGNEGISCALNFKPSFFNRKEKRIRQSVDFLVEEYPGDLKPDFQISDIFNHWFKQLCGIDLSKKDQYPEVLIPDKWLNWASKEIHRYSRSKKLHYVFINAFAKRAKRSWSMFSVIELINLMKKDSKWENSVFIVNSTPEQYSDNLKLIEQANLSDVIVFSAREHFFQLPAIMSKMDLIISVDTAVMHLANAVSVPVVALMRKRIAKWRPIDEENSLIVFNKRRYHHVSKIKPKDVIKKIKNSDFS